MKRRKVSIILLMVLFVMSLCGAALVVSGESAIGPGTSIDFSDASGWGEFI